jgi:hypothetical protein
MGVVCDNFLILGPTQKFRQLRDIRRDPPRLVPGEQASGRSTARLRLIVDVAQCLPVVIPDDKAIPVMLFNIPRRREAAPLYRHVTPSSCSTIFNAVDTSARSC